LPSSTFQGVDVGAGGEFVDTLGIATRHREVVIEVAPMAVGELIVAEEVVCVLTDRLEHPVAGVVPAALDGNERRADQLVKDIRCGEIVVVIDGVERLGITAASQDAHCP
jgi:hypothetical protein